VSSIRRRCVFWATQSTALRSARNVHSLSRQALMSGAGSKITFTLRAMLGRSCRVAAQGLALPSSPRLSAHSSGSAAAQASSSCDKSARACSFAAVAESLAA
jgi:hypothetical protein